MCKSILRLILVSLLTTTGCSDNNGTAESKSSDDTTSPTAGTLTATSDVEPTLSLTWTAATDETSSTAELEYKVVKAATTAEIDTLDEIEALAASEVVQDWTANITSASATGLATGTYAFAVIVRDDAGNKTLYTPKTATAHPACTTNCRIFLTASTYDGNLGGLAGADAKCMSDTNNPGTGVYKALLWTTATTGASSRSRWSNWILKASKTYYRPDGTTIMTTNVNKYANFAWTAAISSTSAKAWTGMQFNWDGGFETCSDFTSNSASEYGCKGTTDSNTSTTLDDGDGIPNNAAATCDHSFHLYCVEQ